MSTIDFTHLRLLAIFSTVVETGSFASAARRLRSSRSRVSEQVASLEADLGIRLLQRSTRQLRITDEGRQIYDTVEQLSSILQSVESIATPAAPSGRVAITMPHDLGHKFLLPRLADFQALYPEIQLDLMLDDARLNLIGEQIDLAIRVGLPKDDSVVARVMHEERLQIFASPSYLKKSGNPKSVKDLGKYHWILLSQVNQSSIRNLQKNGKTIEVKPKTFYRCDSALMAQQMVVQGLGVGCFFSSTVKQELASEQLIPLMPSVASKAIVFALVYPSRRQLPVRTRVLIDFLLASKTLANPA